MSALTRDVTCRSLKQTTGSSSSPGRTVVDCRKGLGTCLKAPGACLQGLVVTAMLVSATSAAAQFELPANRSVYDAFGYMNRIPVAANQQWKESPIDLAGRVFGRLGNQEGRGILKLPEQMTRDDYFALKTFFSFDASFGYQRVGNCASCHVPPRFTDGEKHVVVAGGPPTETPSLRNLKRGTSDIRSAIRSHLQARDQQRDGSADDVDPMLKLMNIDQTDVTGLASFIRLLKDLPGTDKDYESVIQGARTVDIPRQ